MSRKIWFHDLSIRTEQLVKSLRRDITIELLELSGKSHHCFCKGNSGLKNFVEFLEEAKHKWK